MVYKQLARNNCTLAQWYVVLFVYETGFCCVARAGLKLMTLPA